MLELVLEIVHVPITHNKMHFFVALRPIEVGLSELFLVENSHTARFPHFYYLESYLCHFGLEQGRKHKGEAIVTWINE